MAFIIVITKTANKKTEGKRHEEDQQYSYIYIHDMPLRCDTGIREGRNQASTLHRRTDIKHDSAVRGINIISTSEGVQKMFRK